MAQVPTYKDINRERQNADLVQQQELGKQAVRQDSEQQGLVQANPVLQNYMSKARPQPQGLGAYSGIAGQVANESAGQEEYSERMVTGAMTGQLDPEAVLADSSVLPGYKNELMQLIQSSQGLGSL